VPERGGNIGFLNDGNAVALGRRERANQLELGGAGNRELIRAGRNST
jgi:hypothetical protein